MPAALISGCPTSLNTFLMPITPPAPRRAIATPAWQAGDYQCDGGGNVVFCKITAQGQGGWAAPGPSPAHSLMETWGKKILIFFFLSTGDREQSGLLCNQRLCPADNTRGINCPCPAQAPVEGLMPVVGSQPPPPAILWLHCEGGTWSQVPIPLQRASKGDPFLFRRCPTAGFGGAL